VASQPLGEHLSHQLQHVTVWIACDFHLCGHRQADISTSVEPCHAPDEVGAAVIRPLRAQRASFASLHCFDQCGQIRLGEVAQAVTPQARLLLPGVDRAIDSGEALVDVDHGAIAAAARQRIGLELILQRVGVHGDPF